MVRGTVVLPHGTGKSVRVAVFCPPGAKADEALAAGANRYLTKPFDPRQLADVVGSLLQAR